MLEAGIKQMIVLSSVEKDGKENFREQVKRLMNGPHRDSSRQRLS